MGRRPDSAAGAVGAGVEGIFSKTAAAGGTDAEGIVAEGAAPTVGVCAVEATGATDEAGADDADGYAACDTGGLTDAGALEAAGAAAGDATSEDAGEEAGEDAGAADPRDACDAGGGTVMTAEQTEHRARTPAAGTLCGSSSNSVKQDRHCTTMAFIAV